jgi:hypothetical protein
MSGFSMYFRRMTRVSGLFAILALAAAGGLSTAPTAQAADIGCTKICVQIIQAVGDDIREQIPLECIQETGACTGTGYFTAADRRIPVTVEGGLTGSTLTLKVASGQTAFAPTGQDAIVMPLDPGVPHQAKQFVVDQRSADSPFAEAGTSLTVTVIAERLI